MREQTLCAVILLFGLVAYLPWLLLFSITRYLNVLEIIAPLVPVAAACILAARRWPRVLIAVAGLLPIVFSSSDAALRKNVFGPRTPWTDTVFEVQWPDVELDGAMVLVSSGQAMSFIIPDAPESTRFVRVDGNINYVGYQTREERYGNLLGQRIREAIDSHRGIFYVIHSKGEIDYSDGDMEYFGLTKDKSTCAPILSKRGPPLTICRVYRVGPKQP
jgi:hypothetical protein